MVRGRLVLDDRVASGRLTIEDGWISAVELDPDGGVEADAGVDIDAPLIAPGFVDIHVHGWGGHDAMGDHAALDGMARALLRRGVTSFLPTAVSAPIDELCAFAERVRTWRAEAPTDGAEPLGVNLEGPFLAPGRRGAHDPAALRTPATTPHETIEPWLDGLRLMTIAPELDGAIGMIGWLTERGVTVSLGHSDATAAEARAGFDAGARSATHLLNAMTGLDHRDPGLAAAALADERVHVELIADGIHVDRALWPLILRSTAPHRLLLVSDAAAIGGTSDRSGTIGGLAVSHEGGRITLAGTSTLAGSAIALDDAVRNLVAAGAAIADAVAAATRVPLALIGVKDRGRIAVGQRADLVELDQALQVRRVMRAGVWH